MYILLDACQHPGILRIIYFGKLLIDLVFTLLPIGLIVMILIDFSKVVISGEEKAVKNSKIVVQRIINAMIVFCIPWIVNVFMNLLSEASSLKEFTSGNKVYKYERSNKVARYIEDRPFRYGALRKCIFKVMSSQDKDITLADLNKSYIYDKVLEIYNKKGFLIANDFKEVVKANIIGSGSSTYSPYVKEFLKMFPKVEYRSK